MKLQTEGARAEFSKDWQAPTTTATTTATATPTHQTRPDQTRPNSQTKENGHGIVVEQFEELGMRSVGLWRVMLRFDDRTGKAFLMQNPDPKLTPRPKTKS